MKYFFISVIGIVIITCSIIIFTNREDTSGSYSKELNQIINKKMKYDKLESITYDKSGDMIGSIVDIKIDVEKHELTYRHSSAHNAPINVEVYSITDNDIKSLNDKIKEYNLPAWSSLKRSDLIVYDAASESFSLVYDNSKIGGNKSKYYNISFDLKIPTDGYELLRDVRDYMYKLIKKDNLIKQYIEDN